MHIYCHTIAELEENVCSHQAAPALPSSCEAGGGRGEEGRDGNDNRAWLEGGPQCAAEEMLSSERVVVRPVGPFTLAMSKEVQRPPRPRRAYPRTSPRMTSSKQNFTLNKRDGDDCL